MANMLQKSFDFYIIEVQSNTTSIRQRTFSFAFEDPIHRPFAICAPLGLDTDGQFFKFVWDCTKEEFDMYIHIIF